MDLERDFVHVLEQLHFRLEAADDALSRAADQLEDDTQDEVLIRYVRKQVMIGLDNVEEARHLRNAMLATLLRYLRTELTGKEKELEECQRSLPATPK